MTEEEDIKNYDKKIYSFTQQELSKLMPWDMQIQLGAIAEKVLAGILRTECLKRVGVKNSPDINVDYDFVTGQFTTYSPKIWCSACKNKRAEFTYEDKPFCKDCAQTLKQQLEKKPEEKPKKKPSK